MNTIINVAIATTIITVLSLTLGPAIIAALTAICAFLPMIIFGLLIWWAIDRIMKFLK